MKYAKNKKINNADDKIMYVAVVKVYFITIALAILVE